MSACVSVRIYVEFCDLFQVNAREPATMGPGARTLSRLVPECLACHETARMHKGTHELGAWCMHS